MFRHLKAYSLWGISTTKSLNSTRSRQHFSTENTGEFHYIVLQRKMILEFWMPNALNTWISTHSNWQLYLVCKPLDYFMLTKFFISLPLICHWNKNHASKAVYKPQFLRENAVKYINSDNDRLIPNLSLFNFDESLPVSFGALKSV